MSGYVDLSVSLEGIESVIFHVRQAVLCSSPLRYESLGPMRLISASVGEFSRCESFELFL
jgi:hypothetical protein